MEQIIYMGKINRKDVIKLISLYREIKHPMMNEYPQSMTNEEVLDDLIKKGEIELI